jgi:cephalosporin-C deacetylase-like acetyl esterase
VVRLKVLVKDENGALISEIKQDLSYSVVVNADEVTTHKQEPSDFDAFWAAQVAKVTAVSPDVISMEKVSSPAGIQCLDGAVANASAHDFYRVKIKTPDECGYAVGYLTIPKNAKPNSLGITVVFNGYGVSDLSPYISPSNIVLNVCAHSIELGRESGYYKNLLANYGFTGNENRDTSYFRTMIMRDLQAVRFIKAYAGTEGVNINGAKSSLGIWNGKLKLYGESQGAFQGIAVAALDKDVTDAYWYIPWMCDVGGTASEFRPKYTDALRYYDTVFFSKRIDDKVNITLTAGLGDYICPPSGVVALFNEMGGHVTMYFKQGMTHGFTPDGAATTIYQK